MKLHENGNARCGRDEGSVLYGPGSNACVIDSVHMTGAGTIVAIAPRVEPIDILFVADRYAAQESAILEHLSQINDAGEDILFRVAVVPAHRVSADMDFSPVEVVLLSGYSPGLFPSALASIGSSAKPALI
jgi:hypothetical protein